MTNQNSIHEEIKSRSKSGNACCHSVQNILSFSLLPENIKIKIQRTVTLPVVLCGREALSLMLKDEHRLKVFENMVLREIFRLERDEVRGEWRRLHKEKLYALYSSLNIIWQIKSRKMR